MIWDVRFIDLRCLLFVFDLVVDFGWLLCCLTDLVSVYNLLFL